MAQLNDKTENTQETVASMTTKVYVVLPSKQGRTDEEFIKERDEAIERFKDCLNEPLDRLCWKMCGHHVPHDSYHADSLEYDTILGYLTKYKDASFIIFASGWDKDPVCKEVNSQAHDYFEKQGLRILEENDNASN